ncbi:hypothetical protein PC39_10802 [Salinisphaera sp. PC39]|uniref:hypothetical protein n=1 Tax=Salinisphaera sp. PC39 TaxID=1304156 RepID=UPI00333FE78A
MTRLATVLLTFAALIAGGYGVLRLGDGPDTGAGEATPPASESGGEPAPVILWPETDDETAAEPKRPLTTELAPDSLPATGGDARAALAERPYLELDLTPREIARPELETLNLFDPRYNTRGVIQRRWLTENFGLQGGFGYSENEESKERDVAVGVGFVFTY